MKIIFTHSSSLSWKEDIYKVLNNISTDFGYDIFLPQDNKEEIITKDLIKSCDLVIAEVSFPSTGQGIELGWADCFGTPVVYFCKKDYKYSNSIKNITNKVLEYENVKDLKEQLLNIL